MSGLLPYRAEHEATRRGTENRVAGRPRNLRALLRWAQREYAAEPPAKLHHLDEMDEGGNPTMTPAAQSYLGMTREEMDWVRIACARDSEGHARWPMRCAIERMRVREPARAAFVAELLTNVLFPRDVAERHGIPAWAAGDVMYRSLERLWDDYQVIPIPRRPKPKFTELSESQVNAEDAA